jgi:hypothetical protein
LNEDTAAQNAIYLWANITGSCSRGASGLDLEIRV